MPARALVARGWEVTSWQDARPEAALKAKGWNSIEWFNEHARDYDIIMAARSSYVNYVEFLCCLRKYMSMPLIMDFDDHFLSVPDYNAGFVTNHPNSTVVKAARIQLAVSDAATTTTDYMKGLYDEHARRLEVLPNCVDPADWQDLRVDPARADDSSIRIVFAGGSGRYGDLLLCKEAVTTIMDEYPQVRLFFMGCFPDWAAQWCADGKDPQVNRAFSVRWAGFRMWQRVLAWGGFDVALAPLESNDFNRCKSNLKYLDYGMGGVPAVYSRMQTYQDVVHEQTGLLAETPDEWYGALRDLIERKSLRKYIAENAREAVLRDYNIEDRIVLWERAYEQFATLTPNVEAAAWQPLASQQAGQANQSPAIASP